MKLTPKKISKRTPDKMLVLLGLPGLAYDGKKLIDVVDPAQLTPYRRIYTNSSLTSDIAEWLFANSGIAASHGEGAQISAVKWGKATTIRSLADFPSAFQRPAFGGCVESYLVALYDAVLALDGVLWESFGVKYKSNQTALHAAQLHLVDSYSQLSGNAAVFCRRAYTGGFNLARPAVYPSPHFLFDFNSLYGTALRECELPVGKPVYVDSYVGIGIYNCKVSDIKRDSPIRSLAVRISQFGGADVTARPLIRDGESAHVVLTSIDIDTIRTYGGTVEVVDGYHWMQTATPFATFIDHCEEVRTNVGGIAGKLAKWQQNALYGILGSRFTHTNNVYSVESPSDTALQIDDNLWQEVTTTIESKSTYKAPHWAAFIAAWGRAKLFNAIMVADPANVVYSATDSLLVNLSGYNKLMASGLVGTRYGELRLDKSYKAVTVINYNRYAGYLTTGGIDGAAAGAEWGEIELELRSYLSNQSPSPLIDHEIGSAFIPQYDEIVSTKDNPSETTHELSNELSNETGESPRETIHETNETIHETHMMDWVSLTREGLKHKIHYPERKHTATLSTRAQRLKYESLATPEELAADFEKEIADIEQRELQMLDSIPF